MLLRLLSHYGECELHLFPQPGLIDRYSQLTAHSRRWCNYYNEIITDY